jgi:hypothetical protein
LLLAPTYPEAPLTASDTIVVTDVQGSSRQGPTDAALTGLALVFGGGGAAAGRRDLPDPAQEPVAFLEACIKHYDAYVRGYTLRFEKQERVDKKLLPAEVIDVCYRERPHSVYFHWLQPADSKAVRALYVAGENKSSDGESRVKVVQRTGFIERVDLAPESSLLMKYTRYPMNTFGLRQAMMRVLDSWKAAAREKTLHLQYLGLKKNSATGEAVCYTFHRGDYAHKEEDSVGDLMLYIDCMTLLQVGSVVRGVDGKELLGEYYFRNIRINPTFPPEQFTEKMMKR